MVELLKTKFQLDMQEIYKFELEDAQMMNIESDLSENTMEEEEE